MRRAAKRDTVEGEIVWTLRAAGWVVARLSGKDIPDLLVAKSGWCGVVEVKTGRKQLRHGQADWASKWPAPVTLLRTVEDALAFNRQHGMGLNKSSESVRKVLKNLPVVGENSEAQSVLETPATPLATPHAKEQRTA